MVNVEQTPAVAPAMVEGGTARNDGAPFLGVRKAVTVSNTRSCADNRNVA
jgi:hypothetical protein